MVKTKVKINLNGADCNIVSDENEVACASLYLKLAKQSEKYH